MDTSSVSDPHPPVECAVDQPELILSLAPRLAALSAVAGLRELYESDEAQALAAPPSAAELLELVDGVIRFVQAGLEGHERP